MKKLPKIHLYDLPQRTPNGVEIFLPSGAVVLFDHLDGMYSYCTVKEGKSAGQPFHLSASTPLVKVENHYELAQ